MTSEFDELLAILQDENQPLPLSRLPELSDLDAHRMTDLRRAWEGLSTGRRNRLLSELGKLANDHIELTFERINRFALSDAEAGVRRLAIENLWECEDPGIVPSLLAALTQDPDPEVRAAAATALGAFVLMGETEDHGAAAVRQMEDGLLRSASDDRTLSVRSCALESLGFSSREEVPPLIRQAYDSGSEALKRSALLAMGRSADKPWAPQVMTEMQSPAPVLRFEAARAAGELELREAVPALIELLEDVDSQVRRAAIWSLGQLGGTEAAEALDELLGQTEDEQEIELIDDALENLAFVNGSRDFLLIDLDGPEDSST
jgi:HEAT repeat protein